MSFFAFNDAAAARFAHGCGQPAGRQQPDKAGIGTAQSTFPGSAGHPSFVDNYAGRPPATCISTANTKIRQLAAVEARKIIALDNGRLWNALPEETRSQIKQNLLAIAIREPTTLVRHSLAHVISEVANHELDNQPSKWPDLVPQLYAFCESNIESHREIGVYVLYSLFDVIADSDQDIKAHLHHFLTLFSKTLNDASLMVSVSTVQALGKISEFIDNGEDQLIVSKCLILGLFPIPNPAYCLGSTKMSSSF